MTSSGPERPLSPEIVPRAGSTRLYLGYRKGRGKDDTPAGKNNTAALDGTLALGIESSQLNRAASIGMVGAQTSFKILGR
jgi:hypothetical protein